MATERKNTSADPSPQQADGGHARDPDYAAQASCFERLASVLACFPADGTRAVLEASLELCGAHSAAIALRDPDNPAANVRWQAFAGRLGEARMEGTVGAESKAGLEVLRSGTVRHFQFPTANFAEFTPFAPSIVEALACPIVSEGVSVGTLWVFSHENERQFDSEDARRLTQLAVRAALAQRLQTHTRKAEQVRYVHERRLSLLWHSAEVLLTADNPDRMLRALFEEIRGDLNVDTYFNFMVAEGGKILALASCVGITDEQAQGIHHLEFGQAICGTVAVQRVSIVATDIQSSSDPKVQLVKGYGIRAYACNPLMSGDRLLGTLSFASRTRDTFTGEELDFFRVICRYVAVAYERLTLIEGLREADRRKDEFLAMLAHELRNPLAPIRSSVEFIKRKSHDPDLRAAHAIIERQTTNMVRLVDDLLDVARVTQGRIVLQRSRVTLGLVLDQAIESVRPALDAAKHELQLEVPFEPVLIDADPTRLAQVFANLLDNAIKYTPQGGRLRLSASCMPQEIVVTVSDNGVGIPKSLLPRIFDLFTQSERSLARSRGGLGIGLTLVRKLIELHGGTVEVTSRGENLGSEFRVRLPGGLRPTVRSGANTPLGL